MFLLYFYWALTAWGIITGAYNDFAFTLLSFVVNYIYIEFYGAVLHVVLDNPLNLKLPVLWEACLEFQWHHFVSKNQEAYIFIYIYGFAFLTCNE